MNSRFASCIALFWCLACGDEQGPGGSGAGGSPTGGTSPSGGSGPRNGGSNSGGSNSGGSNSGGGTPEPGDAGSPSNGGAAGTPSAGGNAGEMTTAGSGGSSMGGGSLKPPGEVSVTETEIPSLPGCDAPYPHDPAVDEKSGIVYYADSNTSCIGEFNPETMQFRAWPTATANSYPHGLVVDDDGRVFYTGQRVNRVGRVIPSSGMVQDFAVMAEAPHTPVFHQGKLWFTAQRSGQYGHLDPDTGAAEIYDFSGSSTGPYGVWPAPDGSLWVALFGTNRLARIDASAATPTSEEFTLPNAMSRPRRIAVDAKGRVWYTDYPRRMLGMMDPTKTAPAERFREWATPGGGRPYGIAIGPDGRVWYDDEDAPEIVGFDPDSQEVVAQLAIEGDNPGPVRNIAVDRVRNRIWLSISNVGRLGLIQF